jgi:hypothetical protein
MYVFKPRSSPSGGWGWDRVMLATVRVGRGRYYEVITCKDKMNGLEEKLKKMLEEYCRARAGLGVDVLAFFVVKDRDGSVVKVWSLEVHHSLYGPVVYLNSL